MEEKQKIQVSGVDITLVPAAKNPLAVFLGALLQQQRKKVKKEMSIEDIAKLVKVSTSLYKMIESGYTPISTARAFDLVRVFSELRMDIGQLCKYLVGQTYIATLITGDKKIEPKTPQEAFALLAAKKDPDFAHLYQQTREFFAYSDSPSAQKEFVHNVAVPEIRRFLVSKSYATNIDATIADDILIKRIKELSTLTVPTILEFIETFGKIYPQHFGSIAADWEDKNSPAFVSVEGFYLKPDLIVSEENLKLYHYPYIAQSNFKQLKFIFISDRKSGKELKDKFNAILEQFTGSKFSAADYNKVQMKSVHSKDESLNKIKSLLLSNPKQPEKELDAFWVFTMTNGSRVGFVGVDGGNRNVIFNLSYADTVDRTSIFNELWRTIDN